MPRALRRRHAPRREAGFSLVELVVAMMIIAVALMALIAIQIRAAIVVTEARKLQQATAFANEAMEEMRSIPWNTLSRGLYSGYLTAAGGDSLVTGNTLTIDSPALSLIVATDPNDQDPTKLARPLINAGGSNKQTLEDPSQTGVEFTVKAYVVQPSGSDPSGIVGIVVVVEWPGRNGVERTILRSEAYRGADSPCGDADTQPFLAACQSYFEASSSSGSVTVAVSSTNIDLVDPANVVPQPLTAPVAGSEYTLSMRTASASAHLRSQQVNYVDGSLEYGGNSNDDNNPATAATVRGFAIKTVRATDDVTNKEGLGADPATLNFTQTSGADAQETVDASGSPVRLVTQSDYQRPGEVTASTMRSCLTGVPEGQPCAKSFIGNDWASLTSGSGYLLMYVDQTSNHLFRMSRRLTELAQGLKLGNNDTAWVARLASAQATDPAIGCMTPGGAGCVAAGAERTNAILSIGAVPTGTWEGGTAGSGMVQIIKGTGVGCGAYYQESVQVQRGTNNKATAPVVSRCGQVRYWDGTAYQLSPQIGLGALDPITTAPVTWSAGAYSVTATSQVQVLASIVTTDAPDATCISKACTVTASAGSIIVVSTYEISSPGDEHLLIVTTTITGAAASASYKAAPGG